MTFDIRWFAFVLVALGDVARSIGIREIPDNGFERTDDYVFYEPLSLPEVNEPSRPIEDVDWRPPLVLGQVAGVAVDRVGRPLVFHRADREWDYDTFDENYIYREMDKGPILYNTVLTLDSITGAIVREWGNQTFYLPHGIHVDPNGDIWLTDVALHQVFKFDCKGTRKLTLGKRFVPGNDLAHFCSPTAVAVTDSGEVVVADGYCNARLVVYDSTGSPRYSIGEQFYFRVPHSIVILPNREVCLADRENSRVVCFDAGLEGASPYYDQPYSILHRRLGRVFAIASYDNVIYGVNGIASRVVRTKGFTMNPIARSVTGFWGPDTTDFVSPHSIAICPNGTTLYVSEIGPNRVWKFLLVPTSPTS